MAPYKVKNYSDCYLYSIGRYEQNIYKFFIESEIINKDTPAFEDIKFSVKKLSPSMALNNTLDSPNVILLYHANPLPRAFKVFTAKDLKSGDKQLKVFIDMSDLVKTGNGSVEIHPANMDKFISYLTSALMMRIYYSYPEKLLNNSKLIDSANACFAELFTYVIDWLRISGVDRMREKCMYIASIYFQTCILNKDYTDSIEMRAKSISKITAKDIELLDIRMPDGAYKDINNFISAVGKILNADGLKLDNFIEKWLHLFGAGTQFAVEYFPALSTMITNTYNGSYMNNQKTIEKICGRSIVDFTTALFSIGSTFK